MRTLTLALVTLFPVVPLFAQQHPNRMTGFAPDAVFQSSGIDHVNTFNGNLVITIPLGQNYRVDGALSYRLTLHYTGASWEIKERCSPLVETTCYTLVGLEGDSNAGVGWTVSPGRLFQPVRDPNTSAAADWAYQSADGAHHLFYPTLHGGDPSTTSVSYSRDGSYLRLLDSGSGSRDLEFPDGTVHRFDADGKLTEMRDRFGNVATITYPDAATTRISDSHGRNHYIRFSAWASNANRQKVSEVDLETIGGARARYTFNYNEGLPLTNGDVAISRPCIDTDPITADTAITPLLTSVSLPEAAAGTPRQKYAIGSYDTGDPQSCPTEYDPNSTIHLRSGRPGSLTLPTLGTISYTYQPYTLSNDYWPEADIVVVMGVGTRSLRDASGTALGTWTYQTFIDSTTTPRELKNTVIDPFNVKTEHYFSVYDDSSGDAGWMKSDYSLPFTRNASDGSFPAKYLSTRVLSATGALLRSSYARYEYDDDVCHIDDDPCWYNKNRRQLSSRTIYHDDGGAYAESLRAGFDGLGHYREATTGGTFASGNVRTTFTNFNPSVGTYSLNTDGSRASGFTMLPTTTPWVLNTYTDSSVTEGSGTAKSLFCFDASTGALLRKRSMSGTVPSSNDLVARFTMDAAGNTIREEYFGGDVQALGTFDLCSLALPPDQYRVRHTYLYGSLETSQFADSADVPLPFKTADHTIDRSTGLVTLSRDTAGIATSYEYDRLGRLRWMKPASGHGAYTEYVYTEPTSSSSLGKVSILDRPNGSTSGTPLAQSELHYDAFGRVARERRLLVDGTWSGREIAYDAAGRKASVSETGLDGGAAPANWTTFDYDSFGRVLTIHSPDHDAAGAGTHSHDVRYSYAGVSTITRTAKIQLATGEADSSTTEIYDRQGRLWQVREKSNPADPAAEVATLYGYDVGGRLSSVLTSVGQTSQQRTFTYDARGFLSSESHPENGTTTYGLYDARGHAGRRLQSTLDLRFTYDRAERLTEVRDQAGSRLLKEFLYAESAFGDLDGKLHQAKRHNHDRSVAGVVVTETYTYGGKAGRVSRRDTAVSLGPVFSQSFSYTDLGSIATLTYPQRCAVSDCSSLDGPARGVSPAYANGWLQSVPGYASEIRHHPNGALAVIVHGNGVEETHAADPHAMARPYVHVAGKISAPEFNSDGKSDLIWRNSSSGQNSVWFLDGTVYQSYGLLPDHTDASWAIAGAGDFNSDGKADLVWRNGATGDNAVWLLNGVSYTSGVNIPAVTDPAWIIGAVGDFNGDRKPDLVWRNSSTGQNSVWFMDGTTYTSYALLDSVTDPSWRIEGAGDFDGDGRTDLVWRNVSTGSNAIWYLDGTVFKASTTLSPVADQNWTIAGVGDFNRDGRADLVWRNTSTGENTLWLMNGTSFTGVSLPAAAPEWTLAGSTGVENWTSGAYAYDGAGNIARIGSDHFHYDRVGRLVEGTARGAGDRLARYGYDAFGNLTSMRTWVNGVEQSGGPDLTIDPATNRFASSATATYDAFGNQTTWVGGVRTASWDSLQMMATHSDGVNGWDYFYTADDERIGVRRASTGQYDWFLRDLGGKVLRQYTDAAWVKDYVYRDGSLLAAVDASGTRHFHLDHLGTPRLITGANRIATGHTYWPFGEEATSVTVDSERMKFTGHERDLNGGTLSGNNNYLDYMHARYYSPVVGRLLSVDPADSGKPNRPQTWNRYSYAWNRPLNLVDQNGQEPIDPTIARFLGDYFGTNVSHVQVFGGPLARSLAFAFGLGRADAVTLGQRIFYRGEPWAQYKSKSDFGIALTGHEVRHTIDYQSLGFFGFIGEYLRQWISVGFDYNKIPLELAAFAEQEAIEKLLQDPDLLRSIQDGTYGHASIFKESPVYVGVYGGMSFIFNWQGGLFIDGVNFTGLFADPLPRGGRF